MTKIFVIAPLSSLSGRTRLYKLARYISENQLYNLITHVGWERIPGEKEEIYLRDVDINKEIILSGGGYGGRKTRFLYILWMIKVFFYCLFNVDKRSTVWALGFETAFPALLASKIKCYKVIFDDADRFSMLFKLPTSLKNIIEFLEEFTSRNVSCHVVPGSSRYDFASEKMYILKNLPSKSVVDKAKILYKNSELRWPQSKIIIYVNGWLGSGRGMRTALDISSHFSGRDVGFVLAGKLDCIEAEELAKKEQVLYLGNVSNVEALSAYYASDFVFTYYDPSSPVNRHAESNKWGDAIATDTAVLVNSEVETARWLLDIGAAISTPYCNSQSIIEALELALSGDYDINDFKNNIIDFSSKNPIFFEDGLNLIFDKVR
ncbi:hypothetical protein BA894_01650 [Vibrio natriegens]|uniref:hypothetical protein n=1 Tax=Vibrio natriegens TaxID=691 RepID=UPI00080430D2|nr:hypothetical protein [Vibrio natriegens]ANQ25234.1 hypothetical protein BA894_01650 [Vibrio natriegens]